MKHNVNLNTTCNEKLGGFSINEGAQEKNASKLRLEDKNSAAQQAQTRYVNRFLEAYCDCV